MQAQTFPPALPHDELRELFEDVFFVTGTTKVPGRMPMRFSRSMTVIRQGGSLTLISPLRLDEGGLAALDALGRVEHVIRIAGFHGIDDPFYRDRYGARVWAVEGSAYAKGFAGGVVAAEGYFQADVWMTEDTELPLADASLIRLGSATPAEGLVLLDRDGGILVAGDSLQNWARPDAFFSLPARIVMRLMGFVKPHNVGPGWLRGASPDPAELRALLGLTFEHVLPVHGAPVIGDAREKFRAAIERLPRAAGHP